jgi:capsular exopolysaccharide synthesis family protein
MSQIFSALQRAESERIAGEATPSHMATEVLERAERFATSQWEGDLTREKPEEGDGQAPYPTGELREAISALPVSEVRIDGQPLSEERREAILSGCESLDVRLSEGSRLECIIKPESPVTEAFRLLGVRLRDIRRNRTLKTILVTSTIPQEGKSTVAANLACALAQTTKQKVLLLEGDVRRPSQSNLFGITSRPGVCEWLQGERSLIKSMYHLKVPGVWIMPAGKTTKNSLELLQPGRISALIEQVTALFDTIVIDSPPILPLADTSVWMRVADGIILVARQGKTEKRQLQKGIEALPTEKLIGSLLNASKAVDAQLLLLLKRGIIGATTPLFELTIPSLSGRSIFELRIAEKNHKSIRFDE